MKLIITFTKRTLKRHYKLDKWWKPYYRSIEQKELITYKYKKSAWLIRGEGPCGTN